MNFRTGILGAAVLFLAAGAWGQTVWHRADALGNDLGGAAGPSSAGWVLKIEAVPGGQTRTLYHDKAEDSVRQVALDAAGRVTRLLEVQEGVPVWQVTYDAQGLPVQETTFENGLPVEVADLAFEGRVLKGRTVKDPSGTLLYTDRLSRWPDGTLRRLERDGPTGPLAEAAWSYGPDRALVASWAADGETRAQGLHKETTFGARRTVEVLARGAEAVETRTTDWLAAGGRTETVSTPAQKKTVNRTLDAAGRVTQETIQVEGQADQVKTTTYDPQGRPLTARTEGAGPSELWTWTYTEGGPTVALLTRSGLPVREETTVEGDRTQVRYWDRGELFLVETWADGRRVQEAYYSKGVLVREVKK